MKNSVNAQASIENTNPKISRSSEKDPYIRFTNSEIVKLSIVSMKNLSREEYLVEISHFFIHLPNFESLFFLHFNRSMNVKADSKDNIPPNTFEKLFTNTFVEEYPAVLNCSTFDFWLGAKFSFRKSVIKSVTGLSKFEYLI